MSAPVAPTIPPRPNRNQGPKSLALPANPPTIPPRPTGRRSDRSVSPHRDAYVRSPLNEAPFGSNLSRPTSNISLPPRPPSVTLPSIGQEGSEYADLDYDNTENEDAKTPLITPTAEQTRQIANDLHLHAPKPSLPKSSAKAQVQTVTRTDSGTAAAFGYGKPPTPVHDEHDDHEPLGKRLSRTITRPESSTSSQRRQSIQFDDEEHGIPEIGQRVPMYPNAGDVQAPSPAPNPFSPSTGVGFHNNGVQKPRHHNRTKSGREVFSVPPGSYGLHGHGVETADKFEKAWYDKHPEARHEEHGQYGPGLGGIRGEYSLSSEDLNKLVRNTSKTAGPSGLSGSVVYPDEQIGYMATDEYTSRMTSPNPQTPVQHMGRHRTNSQPVAESPLRTTTFPAAITTGQSLETSTETVKSPDYRDNAPESEDDFIHVEDPARRSTKIGPSPSDAPTEDLGPHGGNTADEGGWIDERGYGVPILASDEVAKELGAEHMQPAISPNMERRGSSTFFTPEGGQSGSHTPSASGSRPTSRPGSIHGVGTSLARFASRNEDRDDMHTPLEDVEEYEPLFPDEEDDSGKKFLTAADRFKMRPGTLKRRFPSQDIWEDTPNSLQHYATVSTPDLPAQPTAKTFESPETEAARKEEPSEAERAKLIPKEERLSKSMFAPHLRDDMPTRPDALSKQRFPSRDIWEDTPDSLHLVATVSSPEVEEHKSPPGSSTKPMIPPRPTRSKLGEGATEPSITAQPQIPSRPAKRLHQVLPADGAAEKPIEKQISPIEGRKAPMIPDRPKPQVPARPTKTKPESPEELHKTLSAGSTKSVETVTSPPALKAKPMVPARPAGSKIATLQAGFMSDLNRKLGVGPVAPKLQEKAPEAEVEAEKVPLSDARKGRAKGPQRRRPAAEVSPEKSSSVAKIALSVATMVWAIGEDGEVAVGADEKRPELKSELDSKMPDVTEAPTEPSDIPSNELPLATNPAGNPVDPPPVSAIPQVDEPSSDAPVSDTLKPVAPLLKQEHSSGAASVDSRLMKSADQTPQEEIEDPLEKVPTLPETELTTTTTADSTLKATEAETEPSAAPVPESTSQPEVKVDTDTPPLDRKPLVTREPSQPGIMETLSGQKVDAGKASDALEKLDTGHVDERESKTDDEIAKMRHRGSVNIAETGSLRREDSNRKDE